MERREGLSQGQCVFRSASRRDCHLTPEVLHGPGRVHSVYRSSVNIILENGCFCTLLSPVEDDGPGGILLREPAGFTHPGLALGPGLPVTAERGRLALGKFRVDTASGVGRGAGIPGGGPPGRPAGSFPLGGACRRAAGGLGYGADALRGRPSHRLSGRPPVWWGRPEFSGGAAPGGHREIPGPDGFHQRPDASLCRPGPVPGQTAELCCRRFFGGRSGPDFPGAAGHRGVLRPGYGPGSTGGMPDPAGGQNQ